MLLAEALSARKDALARINSLQSEISESAVVYEDDQEAVLVDPQAQLQLLQEAIDTFRTLSVAINLTNNEVTFAFDGQQLTIMEAVVMRESLKLRARALQHVLTNAESTRRPSRYGARRTTEDIKMKALINLADIRKESDEYSERIRRLDLALQQKNWTTDLVDTA